MFAEFCKILQTLANFGKIFGLIFRARWTIFRFLAQNFEQLGPGAVFAPRECFCFFRFRAFFLINLAKFSLILEQSGPFSAGFSVC